MTITMIETCRIPPAAGAAAELTVPLSFFDIVWLRFHPVRLLLFYHHPCSDADFLRNIVPKLKNSLSITLKHYLPVAGNLLYPSDVDKTHPFFRYVFGDSVPLTVSVSARDFDELTGSHARDSHQFYDFVPELPPSRHEAEYKLVPLIAFQATLFPGSGICISVSFHRCLGDGRSMVGFMWAWAEINKFDGDEEFLSRKGESLPLFDRSVLGDCGRIKDIFWDFMKKLPRRQSSFSLPTNWVRSSFTLRQPNIEKLKNRVLSAKPNLIRVSSFVVTVAYVWSCVAKSTAEVEEEVRGDEPEVLLFPADGRGRANALIDPPVPENYFGNFLGLGKVIIERGKLLADNGFLLAAEGIADQIKNQVYYEENFLKDVDKWPSYMRKLRDARIFGVSGSPKFNFLNADFGWGKARSLKVLSMDNEKYSMLLSDSMNYDGGLVVRLSLSTDRMKAFEALFVDGLK